MSDTHAQTVPFVRETMVPPAEPPLNQTGAVRWLRENLFSGWLNTILTLIAIYAVWTIVTNVAPWLLNAVWQAGSLAECREVLLVHAPNAAHGGACAAVAVDRWQQILFGFYPADSYWRPVLAFVLMFVALAPVLFADRLPKVMLIFSLAYPFIAVWLLWGGAWWVPVLAFLGLVVGYLAARLLSRFDSAFLTAIGATIAAILWWGAAMTPINDAIYKAVAKTRIESTVEDLEQQAEVLPAQVAELDDMTAAAQAKVAALSEEKAAIIAEITAARDAGGEASAEQIAAFDDVIDRLDATRQEASTYSAIKYQTEQDLGVVRNTLQNTANIPLWEAELPNLIAARDDLMAKLPETVAGFSSTAEAQAAPPEDVKALQDYLNADLAVVNMAGNIETTYKELGRVGLKPVTSRELGGFMLAIIIGMAGIVLSLPLGILLALGRQSHMPIIKGSSVAFIETIRGVPLIVWLFTASLLLNYFMPPGTNFDLVLRVVIMVTLFAAAYIAEVIRGGLAALPKGQYEAADALGLDYWKAMRLIILPQALKISIPGIVNTFIGLFKDTTLVGIIGLMDPVAFTNSIRASTDWNGIYWELFIFIGLIFFVCCFSMGRYSLYLERKLRREHR